MATAPLILAFAESLKGSDLALFGGLALITMALMLRYVRRRRAGGSRAVTPAEHLERVRQQKGMRADLEHLMVEIEQLAKRLGAQLDAKAMHLERLLREADERAAELRRLGGGGAPTREAEQRPAPRRPPMLTPDDEPEPWPAPGAPGAAAAGGPAPDPLARSVYELADAGQSSTDIARRLNEHVGKVELILALRSP